VLVFGVYAYFYQGGGWSLNSRFDLTRAIVEQRTIAIDAFHENTGDKAQRGAHYFCDKAPGLSWLAVPPYAVAHVVRPHALAAGAYVSTLFAVALPSALAAVVLFDMAAGLGLSAAWAAALSAAYALGTLVFPYSTLFQGHALAAALAIGAWAFARDDRSRLAGFLIGLGVCVDYTFVFVAVALAIVTLVRRGTRGGLDLAIGGAPAAVALAAYHAAAFGHPLRLPYDFVLQEHRHQGWFMGIAAPSPSVLVELLVGPYRGLFYSAPWLAGAIPGLFLLWRKGHRAEAAVAGSVAAAYLLLNAGLVDWHGAWAMGPRYLILAIPFLAVGTIGLALDGRGQRALAVVAGVSVAFSMAMMLMGTAVKPEVPLDVRRPYAEFLWPRFRHGNLARNTQSIDSEGGTDARQAWNLGHLVGLEGLWTLAPLAAWVGVTGTWLAQRARAGGGASEGGTGLPSAVPGSMTSTRVPSGSNRLI
jgi:hypothetical protein